ncbi:hypothetical protein IVB38_39835 [Bradyrhizobium sp. 38]|uniref:hypothetical protein n=1 Tax=unclassified Bradyrhizobium TaxID=2631580 RepID=UPI001FF8DC63|nr:MULTISPECIES: hypothetical protein [unclassified Bradyrhizobium]MCK1341958.1 hypothetical protein [Bradyrhizobium sp. 38]MCK1781932.1 hypothetical protein [Bradyrhizobium sp. 132]
MPIDDPNHGRTPAVLLMLAERNDLIRAAARFFPAASARDIARRLRSALLHYQTGSWRRDRDESTCPMLRRGKAA